MDEFLPKENVSLIQQLVEIKRKSCGSEKGSNYKSLLRRAQVEIPKENFEQIQIDLPRTFLGLPEVLRPQEQENAAAQECLGRVLLASEWRNGNAESAHGLGAAYTQGMNYIAAMCLAMFRYEEEPSFWVFTEILENTLGIRFFAEWPPLLGYHALVAVAQSLTPSACPKLARVLGEELGDVAAMLGCKFFIPCFVGHLPAPVLMSLWSDLLLGPSYKPGVVQKGPPESCANNQPLMAWFLGLLQYLEPELLKEAENHPDPDFPKAPTIFQAVIKKIDELPADWKPQAVNLCPSAAELSMLIVSEEERILAEAQDKQLVSKGGIPPQLIKTLHQEFLSLPGEEGGGISLATLRTVLWRVAPRHIVEESSTCLFELLDRDNSGSLDFFELMTGILVLCEGSRDKKLRLIFSLYDTDGSGHLDKDELLCLAKALVKLSGVSAEDAWSGMLPGSSSRPNSPARSTTIGFPSLEKERSREFRDNAFKFEPSKSRPRSIGDSERATKEFSKMPTIERRRWSHSSATGLGLSAGGVGLGMSVVSRNLRRTSVFADIAQCVSAEQFRRRLLLLDTTGVGRVSLDDFLVGAPCDETVCRCLAQVGVGLTEETKTEALPKTLSKHQTHFEIEGPPRPGYGGTDRGQRCSECVKRCSMM